MALRIENKYIFIINKLLKFIQFMNLLDFKDFFEDF
jgi:hypothetical protein